ncbi:MAG: PAS domain S-box protein [Candidatus Anammoxibacter sp.]
MLKAFVNDKNYYQLIIEGGNLIGWEYCPNKKSFTFVSKNAPGITGHTLKQWSEPGFWESHIHQTDRKKAVKFCKDATKKGVDHVLEYRMVTANGGFVWLKDVVQVVFDKGKVDRLRGIFVDITEQKLVEDELNKNKNLLQSVFDGMQEGISVLDNDLNIIKVNHAMEKLYPHIPCLTGQKCYKAYHNKSKRCKVCPSIRAINKNSLQYDIVPFTNIEGEKGWLEVFATPLKDNKNNVVGVIEHVRDITKRKEVDELLQEQKKSLEQKNIALNEMLKQLEIEKKKIVDNMTANVENFLLPGLEKLKLRGESNKYVELLIKNVNELTSSFGVDLTKNNAKLTSRETEICNMIKSGLSNKEISKILHICIRTIEKHRSNIRKKLNINNHNVNLESFLKTL